MTVLDPNATTALEITTESDSFVTGMVTFCFNESSKYCQCGEIEVHVWFTCAQWNMI